MSLLFAALNPNISNDQLIGLMKKKSDCDDRVIATFRECLDSLPEDQKAQYMSDCLPVLTMMLMF